MARTLLVAREVVRMHKAFGRLPALVLPTLLAACAQKPPYFDTPVIGVELPFAGRDAGDGLQARQGIELAIDDWNLTHKHFVRVRYRDSALHLRDPHEDEGQDPVGEPDRASIIAKDYARDDAVVAMIGGLHAPVVRAEADVTGPAALPLISGGAVRGASGVLFAVADVTPLARDRAFTAHYHQRNMEAATPEALRFYAATLQTLAAIERSDGTRRGVMAALDERCPGGTCPAPTPLAVK